MKQMQERICRDTTIICIQVKITNFLIVQNALPNYVLNTNSNKHIEIMQNPTINCHIVSIASLKRMIKGRFNDIYSWFIEVFDINILCAINVHNLGYEIILRGLWEHKSVNYNCSFGGVALSEPGSSKRHKEVQHSVHTFKCDMCANKTGTEESL